MGHLHCAGARESEGAERRIPIGGENAVPVSVFPECFAYVALGHLHGPQSLDGGRIRYPGSCFPLSASEIGHRHGATLVEIGEGGITHSHVEIERPAAFHRISDIESAELEETVLALELDPDLPRDLQPFVYVTLKATGPAAVVLQEAENLLARHPVRPASIRVIREDIEAEDGHHLPGTLAEVSPESLFLPAFLQANGIEAENRHILAFRDAANRSE